MPDKPHDYAVSAVNEVADRFQGVGVPGAAELLDKTHYRLWTGIRPRLRPILSRVPDYVRGKEVSPRIHVSRVPRFERGSHDLNVFLRHRLRSIPQGSA